MSSRASKRNTQGGKAFKSKAKGGIGFRAQAAQDAANEMLDLILARENGYKGFSDFQKAQAESAMLEIQVGRISRKFGKHGKIRIRVTYFPRTMSSPIRSHKVVRGALVGVANEEVGKIR